MIDPMLDAATRVCELADKAADQAEGGERAETTKQRDALRQVGRFLAEAMQVFGNAEEAFVHGQVRPRQRAASPRLYALREAALHMRQLVERSIVGPEEEGGATARPVNLSDLTDAQLREAAGWLEQQAADGGARWKYAIGAACVRAYLSERAQQREAGQ